MNKKQKIKKCRTKNGSSRKSFINNNKRKLNQINLMSSTTFSTTKTANRNRRRRETPSIFPSLGLLLIEEEISIYMIISLSSVVCKLRCFFVGFYLQIAQARLEFLQLFEIAGCAHILIQLYLVVRQASILSLRQRPHITPHFFTPWHVVITPGFNKSGQFIRSVQSLSEQLKVMTWLIGYSFCWSLAPV